MSAATRGEKAAGAGLVVGVDLGTSGARAVAFDAALAVVAQASRSYAVHYAAGGIAEQPVEAVIEASEACIGEVASRVGSSRVRALAFCSTASSLALFEATGSAAPAGAGYAPAGAAWLWSDSRAAAEARLVAKHFGVRAYERTGCPVHASYWPAKLRWWREHAYGPFAASAARGWGLAGQKDYLLYRLTGQWATDRATAAATGLYNSQQWAWDGELLEWLGIEPDWLPHVVPLTEQFALLRSAAERLGLDPGTRVVAGGLDGVLVHLGMGCARPGLASCTIGTSSAVRMSSERRATDPAGRTWCYPIVDGLWLAGGAGNNGGNVLTWFQALCADTARLGLEPGAATGVDVAIPVERIIDAALEAEPGADGLVFVPYLFGERSPLWREDLTGAFVGLTPIHHLPQLARAVLEGIGLAAGGIYRALVEQIGPAEEIRAGGGFVARPAWVQLQADILGAPVGVTVTGLETAQGAAMLAWHAVEGIPLPELQAAMVVTQRFAPRPAMHELYLRLADRLQAAVKCLAGPISP